VATAPPLEDRGPLSGSYYLPAQNARNTHLPLRKVQRLGQDIRQLEGGSDVDQLHVAILDHFMREVLPNVDMLGPLPSANDVVTPLDARSVVLVHRSRGRLGEAHVLEQVTKVDDLRCRRRRRIVLRLGRG